MNDCIEFDGPRNRDGYGQYGTEPHRGRLAHRIAWRETNGPIPEGMVVMHICDNPACINLDHLRLGTQGENIADRDRKRRRHVKLTPADVASIKKSLADGETPRTLATQHSVHISTIHQIGRGATWKSATKEQMSNGHK